jgi:pyruvate kinase
MEQSYAGLRNDLKKLTEELLRLRNALTDFAKNSQPSLSGVPAANVRSALNLLHYLALRQHDIRQLQFRLVSLGLSSLGRAESCVLANIDAVLNLLHCLLDRKWSAPTEPPISFEVGRSRLQHNTDRLLGPAPPHRWVRIMVTMPADAGRNYDFVRQLVMAGMNCARINSAHDGPVVWKNIANNVRRASEELALPCRILVDLAGPKVRTGACPAGPAVIKARPRRDVLGNVLVGARIWLESLDEGGSPPADTDAILPVDPTWLAHLVPGDRILFDDARGSSRTMTVAERTESGCLAELSKTAYFTPGTRLVREAANQEEPRECSIGPLPSTAMRRLIQRGQIITLSGKQGCAVGEVADPTSERWTVPCTLPEVFSDVRIGERVLFDDGKIGGVIRSIRADEIDIEITHARPGGEKLGTDKGINLPDSKLQLPALTQEDLAVLSHVTEFADLIGLSFVHSPQDLLLLQERLAQITPRSLGIILKIETQRAFEKLPELTLAALRSEAVGLMIARGDLAVECGFERLAEIQEEILWICEAAHIPVIWATQVLEKLAKDGTPSRAEITDAAMSVRAECVMLNKGPHILEAIQVLDSILRRMQQHQNKKRSMLRPLRVAKQAKR